MRLAGLPATELPVAAVSRLCPRSPLRAVGMHKDAVLRAGALMAVEAVGPDTRHAAVHRRLAAAGVIQRQSLDIDTLTWDEHTSLGIRVVITSGCGEDDHDTCQSCS